MSASEQDEAAAMGDGLTFEDPRSVSQWEESRVPGMK